MNLTPFEASSEIRKTTMPRKRNISPVPLRFSNHPEPSQRARTQTEILPPKRRHSPERNNLKPNKKRTKSKKNSKRKKSRDKSKGRRDVSPTLITSLKKIINNDSILKYTQENKNMFWIRDFEQGISDKKNLNPLEGFFYKGMSMRDCANKEMCMEMGSLFFHSNLCLPVYIFRKSKCRSRIFLNDDLLGNGKSN
jgi:hypothetical protein